MFEIKLVKPWEDYSDEELDCIRHEIEVELYERIESRKMMNFVKDKMEKLCAEVV